VSTNLASGKSYTRTNVYNHDSDTKLTDGTLSSPILETSKQIWWYQTAWDVVVDLSGVYSLEYVRFFYEVWLPATVPAPPSVTIHGSLNNTDWTSLGSGAKTTNWSDANGVHWSNNLAVSGSYRYVKYTFGNPGGGAVCALAEVEVYGATPYATPHYLKDRPRGRVDLTGVSMGLPNPTSALPLSSAKHNRTVLR
jgi:hypothetical protein